MSELPSWNDLKRLIAGPKPPVRARAIESSPDQNREAWVLHDGQNGWHITEGPKTELTSVDSTTIVNSGRFETVRGMGVASNNWVKSLIQGRLMAYLDESTGQILDSRTVEGRQCWVADVFGLRRDEPTATFRVWVDTDTGIILREERTDADAVVELRDIEIGNVVEETPPIP